LRRLVSQNQEASIITYLILICQTLASDGLDTCVCHDKGLRLSKQGEGGGSERLSSLLPHRLEPVHSEDIRLTGCSPSSLEKATAYPEFRYIM
ncbi:hypothetical protein, partial [Bacteroides heparinolyticus]|uniref:hypothetical protein n=1 Tax=Prevotella heparinolytica TaxID=28113 RepID=UPI0035A172C1